MKPSVLRVLRSVHRWAGLTIGLLLVLVALSGSLLLFQPQIFRWAHGDLIPTGMSSEVSSLDRWLANGRAAVPGMHGPIAIWRPHVEHNITDAGMLVFEGGERAGFGQTGLAAVLVAPATGDVLGVIDVDHSLAYAPVFFHSSFLAGGFGSVAMGAVAVCTFLLLAIGLYLWWPSRARFVSKLSPRPLRTLKYAGRIHDWLGGWAVIVLLMSAFTGVYLAQPDWIEPALRVLPAAPAEAPTHPAACGKPVSLETAVAKAQVLVPGGVWAAIEPQTSANHWEILLNTHQSEAAHAQVHVLANLDCGSVTVETLPGARPAREATELWMIGLHDGTALGRAGEIFMAIVGLMPLVLFWSGARMWWRRRTIGRGRPGGR